MRPSDGSPRAVDAHLALETGIVGEEPAHEIAVEGETKDVAPKGERGFILHAIDLAVDAFLISQTDADVQAVVESVLRHDVPVEGLAYPHDVAVPAAQEIKRVVGLLDYQELAGHPGEGEVVAHLGFGYFTEGDGYVEVFYHLWGFFCPKIRVWRIQNEPCPVYFTDKARFCGIRGTSVIRDKGLVVRSVEHDKDFGLLLLQPLVLAQGVEHPLAEQLRAIGVDTEAEEDDGLQIVVGNI